MRRALPIAFAMFLAGLVSFLVSRLDHRSPPTTTVARALGPTTTTPAPSPSTLDPIALLDLQIAGYRERAQTRPDDWMDWEFVAIYQMDRARLTGDYTDWRRADDAVTSAFEAGHGFGPYLTRATLNSALHRIDRVEADLDAVSRGILVSPSESGAVLALRGDARFYAGRYAEARVLYEQQMANTRRGPEALGVLAQLESHTGHFDEAERLLDEAARHPSAQNASGAPVLAWVLSSRARMERDRGRLDDALAAIAAARALTPNDPHLDELAAEIQEAHGDADDALHAFRSVAARTSSPQSLDGAARILVARGDTIAAQELVALARQSYEAQIALLPEAAYGHAIDHWLRLEPEDVDTMIAIAEGNAEARPYGETRVKLAMAYLLAGRIADARAVLDAVLATEWSTADLHGVNAIALERAGQDGSAERAVAEAIAPGAMLRLAWLDQ